jgi:hypothetical protein
MTRMPSRLTVLALASDTLARGRLVARFGR